MPTIGRSCDCDRGGADPDSTMLERIKVAAGKGNELIKLALFEILWVIRGLLEDGDRAATSILSSVAFVATPRIKCGLNGSVFPPATKSEIQRNISGKIYQRRRR